MRKSNSLMCNTERTENSALTSILHSGASALVLTLSLAATSPVISAEEQSIGDWRTLFPGDGLPGLVEGP